MNFKRNKDITKALDIGVAWKDDIFRITQKDVGKKFNIRLLPNNNDITQNILKYRVLEAMRYRQKCLCMILINGEIKIFHFSMFLYNWLVRHESFYDLFSLNNTLGIQILVKTKSGFLDYEYSTISNTEYDFGSTASKQNHIMTLYDSKNLDLEYTSQKLIEMYTKSFNNR